MDAAQGVSLGIGIVLGCAAVLGLFYRVVLLPALRKDLIEPMRETHQAVTTNGHTSADATLKDDVRDSIAMSEKALEAVELLRGEIRGLTGRVDRHLDWSVDMVSRLEREIHGKADRQA